MYKWIESLKVGDLVFVRCRHGQSLKKVEKITPKGYIKVGGTLFDKSGTERGGDIWNKEFLSEATPEKIKSFQEKLIINKAIKIMRSKAEITLEQAYKIIELLDHPTEKGETEQQIQIGKAMIEKMVSCYNATEKGGAE